MMRFDVNTKLRTVSELMARYPTLEIDENLRSISADWIDVDRLPWTGSSNLNLNTKEQEPQNSEITHGEESDVEIRVILLRLPKVSTRFMIHTCQVVMTKPGGSKNAFFGGFVDSDVDGEDTDDFETQLNAARRYLSSQANLDLSGLETSNWIKFATFSSNGTKTVYVIPMLWESNASYEVSQQRWSTTTTETLEVDKEIEEEVEEEVPATEEGGEPTTTTKIVKKTVKETVTKEKTEIKPFAIPVKVSLKRLTDSLKTDHWQQPFIGEMFREWITLKAGEEILSGLTKHSGKLLRQATKRKAHEEREKTRSNLKRQKTENRDILLKELIESMELTWKEDDQGLTEDEIAEAAETRKKEKEDKIKEIQEEWTAEDLAAETIDNEADNTTDTEEREASVVNEDLLTSFSIFDQGLRSFGGIPREDVNSETIKQLIMSTCPISQLATQSLLPAGQKIRYRSITDTEES